MNISSGLNLCSRHGGKKWDWVLSSISLPSLAFNNLLKVSSTLNAKERVESLRQPERKEGAIKILALQGSPRPKKYTQMVLDKFLGGAAGKGAECGTVHLANKKINPCIGCYTCWYKTPGVCIHKDDLPLLLEKLKSCDVEVWATPLYHYGMTAYMKLFMERTLPLIQPYLIENEGVTSHPSRFLF